jgi:short-subunit dehydrogenase
MKKKSKKNLVMVITGASSGIGLATAREWASRGGTVVLAARSSEVLEEEAAVCEDAGGKALVVQADVSKEEDVNRLVKEVVKTFGKIDVWLNNAAAMIFGEFNEIPTEDFRRILETNLFGVIYGARAAIQQFRRQGKGILINMGSLAGIVGQPYSTPYSISKGAIRALGISLGQELENEKHIHVCTVHPSIVDTPVFQNAANYSGQTINPPTSATPVLKVVKAILKLTKHPQREVFVGKRNLLIRLNRSLSPKLFDKAYRKVAEEIEFEEESAPKTSGNLFAPIPEHASVSGGWLEKEKKGKRTTIKTIATKAAVVAGILMSAGWWLSHK